MRVTTRKSFENKFQSVKVSKSKTKSIKGGNSTDYVIIEEIIIG